MWMYNGASWWGQAFDHWCLAVFFVGHTWLYKGVTFVFLLSFPLPLPFDWTLRCWVCVCCFVLLYFGYYVVLCVKNKKLKIVDNKKTIRVQISWNLILWRLFTTGIRLLARSLLFWPRPTYLRQKETVLPTCKVTNHNSFYFYII